MHKEGVEVGTGVQIERIIGQGPLLDSYQLLMERAFDPETLDPIEVTGATLEESDPKAQLILLGCVDTHNQVVAALNASYLAAYDEEGADLGWDLLVINYIACAEGHQRKGLAKKLYKALEEEVKKLIETRQKPLRLVLGETDPDVEGLVNKMPYKRRRLFALQSDGTFKELPYEQPPMDFDENGATGSSPVPLHLMASCPDDPDAGQVPSEVLIAGVRRMLEYNLLDNARERCSIEGHARVEATVQATMDWIQAALVHGNAIYLLTREQREQLRVEGMRVIGYDPIHANASPALEGSTTADGTPMFGQPDSSNAALQSAF